MEVEVKRTSVQKQVNGVGAVFNIKDAYVVAGASGSVENANGNLYRKADEVHVGSFNYSPGNSSIQVNDIADIAVASQDVADFIAAVEVSNPVKSK
ncbi:hypothetical protein [uncultured Parabacteroides sp.]|jgi:hypothetical protein|uniref:hypothetical protein n=1 Tax=uncultured Parabacteroides sp. TaxID=512312 RepID=UPI0025EA067D|nr:hypothetical protein [uncultured Parabacteroides sp.]